MRPIDYVIKLEVAFGMAPDYFVTLAENLYYEENEFMQATLNILKDECELAYDRVMDVFHNMDIAL